MLFWVIQCGALIAFTVAIHFYLEILHTGDRSLYLPIIIKPQPAITWRFFIQGKLSLLRGELYTRGRARQPAHGMLILIKLLMHMPPQHCFHIWKISHYG